jgi:hypothetical protein
VFEMLRSIVGLATCALVAAPARADDDAKVLPCRPTVTCTAELAPPGTLELEVGEQLQRGGGAWSDAVPLLVKLPIARWFEAQVGTDYFVGPGARYLDNVALVAKFHLHDQAPGIMPAVALSGGLTVPTFAQQGYARAVDAFATLHVSKDIGSVHLDGNVGLIAWALDGATSYQEWAALAASYALTARWSIAIEPHLFADAPPNAAHDGGALAAVGFTPNPRVVIDAAVYAVATQPQSLAALVGVSLAPARLWGGR